MIDKDKTIAVVNKDAAPFVDGRGSFARRIKDTSQNARLKVVNGDSGARTEMIDLKITHNFWVGYMSNTAF
jgi:cyanophycinase-like exopeptidase